MKSRNYSVLAFTIVAVLTLSLSLLSNIPGKYPLLIGNYMQRILTTIFILIIAFLATKISFRIGMQQCWYGEGLRPGTFLTPILTGIILGGLHILIFELLGVYPFEGSPKELYPLISETLLLALVLNFSIIVALIYISDRVFVNRNTPTAIFWIVAALIAVAEPIIITMLFRRAGLFDALIQPVFMMELYYIIGLLSIAFLRYTGFLAMILFRIFEIVTVGLLAIFLY